MLAKSPHPCSKVLLLLLIICKLPHLEYTRIYVQSTIIKQLTWHVKNLELPENFLEVAML